MSNHGVKVLYQLGHLPILPTPMPTPVPPPIFSPGPSASKEDLRGVIELLSQIVSSKSQQLNNMASLTIRLKSSTSSRVDKFFDPPVFTSTKTKEDPKSLLMI